MPQLLDDLVHRLGRGFDRKGAGGAPQAPVPGAVPPIQIEVDKRDILQLDVFPNVEFGPVQQRVDPDVRALREGGFELIPEFRRLIPEVPLAVLVARRKVSFLGPRALLIRPDAEDNAGVPLFFHQLLQRVGLEGCAAGHPPKRMVHPCRQRLLVLADNQVQAPFAGQPIPVLDHGGDFVAGVDVQERERHVAQEGLAREPQEHRRVFAHGPEHGKIVEVLVRLPQDVDALILELT